MDQRLRSFLLTVCSVLATARGAAAQQSTPTAGVVTVEHKVELAKKGRPWLPAVGGMSLVAGDRVRTGESSRALLRLADRSLFRLDELSKIEILPPARESTKPALDLPSGAIYFFSREKPRELEIRTPAATGGLRGTELHVRVAPDGHTTMAVFDGEVELSNRQGSIVLRSGEQGEAAIGEAPRKTAMIEAVNIIQWCLYYPGVVDPAELQFTPAERPVLAASLAAYRQGDLLEALRRHPGTPRRASDGAHLYRAAVLLSVGQVGKAETELGRVDRAQPAAFALRQLIAAVKFQEFTRRAAPDTPSAWMANSYYRQSRLDLEGALAAARSAAESSPEFGFAWTRVAELEFSFGRTARAIEALDRGLALAPRHAQAHALGGFLSAAQNRIGAARERFDAAIGLDGALGNAWLGRGLTHIRQGRAEVGRLDLQTAAALEPNRSILRSYLGKAFSLTGDNAKANRELERAHEIDPNDPTPWLYSAIQRKQENRYNAAIDELERSITLNDNRRLFRSRFLLDQDRSIRGTNLAAIYLNNGLREQSVREAVRSVNGDYGSAPAHLFLANSYNALRDPTRILLRYETAWFNELLLSNLLSPVGGGPLSQFVTEQEYSKLFERDGLGLGSVTEYYSYGELRETASQYGTFGNLSYAFDAEYQYHDGLRPNNRISRLDSYAQFKLQLGPQDTVFFQTKVADLESGDVFQRYDQRDVERTIDRNGAVAKNVASLTYDFRETQEPALLLLGWHHEWSPGNHTLLLGGRIANAQVLTVQDTNVRIVTRDVAALAPTLLGDPFRDGQVFEALQALTGRGRITATTTDMFDLESRASFETYTAELQQIITLGPTTTIMGGRYQDGQFDTQVRLSNSRKPNPAASVFDDPPAHQDFAVDFERINLYAYETWRVALWLSLTAGVTYDSLRYPDNFRNPPINSSQASLDKVSPKLGFILQPAAGTVLRGSYMEAISGASFDESIRLEPTQVAGFTQAYRTLASESLIGSVSGSEYKLWGASLEQKLPTRTYLGATYESLQQDVDRTIGVFDFLTFAQKLDNAVLPSSLSQRQNYREDVLTATANQLIGEHWSVGARYRATRSQLRSQLAGVRDALARAESGAVANLAGAAETQRESTLHELSLFALYNHPNGFFARAEGNWFRQDNDTFSQSLKFDAANQLLDERRVRSLRNTRNSGPPGDDFWQFNVVAGWRFLRNQCEVSFGFLNITGADYQLDPLNPYFELPRDRTFVVRAKFSF